MDACARLFSRGGVVVVSRYSRYRVMSNRSRSSSLVHSVATSPTPLLSSSDFRHLNVSYPRPGVLLLVLSRPSKLNALSAPLMKELKMAFDSAVIDDDVGCVVLTAEGKVFCAGSDIKGDESIAV